MDKQVVKFCSNSELLCQFLTTYLSMWLGWVLPGLASQRGDELGEIQRIQELFPNDNLRLNERDPVAQKMKGLIRKRSTTAARLQRAFSAKGRSPDGSGGQTNNKEANYSYNNNNNNEGDCNGTVLPSKSKEKPKRQFIMETPVQFTTGVQSQERHLFLFSDLLLVAKARSGGNFKLKEKVRVSEMWLATCLDDVTEVCKSGDTSFVMGWPMTNVVASFSCVATKDLWYNKLSQIIAEERDKDPPSTTIQITYYDPSNNIDICKTMSVASTTTARECISLILDHLDMGDCDTSKFQLWVKTGSEEAPYPLIGHEYPFAIKMNCIRDLLQDCDAEQCNNLYNSDVSTKCKFILRQEWKILYGSTPEVKKASKKTRKSPIKIHNVFKRTSSKGDVTDGGLHSSVGLLFGQPLTRLCDNDGSVPKPVMDMLSQLFLKGPFTVGIFRKSANARLVRELKEKLDSSEEVIEWEGIHIMAVAALFKDFLRSLPDCLLCSDLYEEWLQVPHLPSMGDKASRSSFLCSRIPGPNLTLLKHFLCVLHYISRRSSENMMSSSNLAVCVGPSLLWSSSPILALSPEESKQAPAIVEFLIDNSCIIFGKNILHLLGDPPEQDPLRQDSGAEESDSLHSLHSGHSLHSSSGMRRDDSSIDSLERDFLVEGELSPLPRKDKMSLTNLSRDSGLTMSDSQLYTPDEEESESTSSGHSGGDKGMYAPNADRVTDRFQHYTAPNNPNAIYAAVYRRPEKVTVSYDEPDGYYASPNREHTRVQITYSSPSYGHTSPISPKEYSHAYHCHLHDPYTRDDGDGIYSTPGPIISHGHIPPFVTNSNFQRHDWMRRRSNLRKMSKNGVVEGGLIRSNSEESLLNKYNCHDYGMSLGPTGNAKHIHSINKGRALPLPPADYDDSLCLGDRESPIRRSKSAHYLTETGQASLSCSPEQNPVASKSAAHEPAKWQRSRSTPQIHEEGDRSYDSSTLSDDDSTPHVSRSNSRGKECGNGNLHAWDASCITSHASDSGGSHNSRNSSFKSERTGSVCTVVSAGSTSTLSSNPPSYEEALNRKCFMMKSPQQSLSAFPDHAIREEKVKSARAKLLYEESLRIYQEENAYPCDLVRASPAHAHDSDDSEIPPPLPPKNEPPPLPPKQRAGCCMNDGTNRLKHLPPVHVELSSSRSKSRISNSILSSSHASYEPPYHKTIIYTDDCPPTLPPKERTIIEVESVYSQIPEKRLMMPATLNSPQKVEKKSIETQTDECDLLEDDVKDESIQTSGSWMGESHITSVSVVPDSSYKDSRWRGRPGRRDSSASLRSRSMPSRESGRMHSDSEDEDEEWVFSTNDAYEYPTSSLGLKDVKQLDPELQQEISWSVSQLRAIFGESLKGAKVHTPPYRPPPSAHRAPITSYHLGVGDAFTSRKTRSHSSYGEESYV